MTDAKLHEIKNYLAIGEALGTAGQPAAGQFADIAAAGFEVVINLAMPDSDNALENEREIVEGLGMVYIHIPVVWEDPQIADVDEFFAMMDAFAGKKLFVHCAANMRVSAFVFLYRVTQQGVPPEIARADLHRLWEPNPVWSELMLRVMGEYRI